MKKQRPKREGAISKQDILPSGIASFLFFIFGLDIQRTSSLNFLYAVKAACELNPERRLYAVRAKFWDNLHCQFCSSAEIFQAAYDDPTGAEYWRGWFDKPSLTVWDLGRLLAIHKAVECLDVHIRDEDRDRSLVNNVYETSLADIIIKLRDAAKHKDNDLQFYGHLKALKDITSSEALLGFRQRPRVPEAIERKPLSLVEVHPRKALKWFARVRERADLLPESLRAWWANQITMMAAAESAKREEPNTKPTAQGAASSPAKRRSRYEKEQQEARKAAKEKRNAQLKEGRTHLTTKNDMAKWLKKNNKILHKSNCSIRSIMRWIGVLW